MSDKCAQYPRSVIENFTKQKTMENFRHQQKPQHHITQFNK